MNAAFRNDTHVNFQLLWLRENVLYLILQNQYLLIKVYMAVAVKTFTEFGVFVTVQKELIFFNSLMIRKFRWWY